MEPYRVSGQGTVQTERALGHHWTTGVHAGPHHNTVSFDKGLTHSWAVVNVAMNTSKVVGQKDADVHKNNAGHSEFKHTSVAVPRLIAESALGASKSKVAHGIARNGRNRKHRRPYRFSLWKT